MHNNPEKEKKRVNDIAIVSGGFDPVHVGHIRMFKSAARLGTLIVGLNSDDWLKRKKGYVFMPFAERKEVIEALGCVHVVLEFDDSDNTCIDLLRYVKKNFADDWTDLKFCNGGDRTEKNVPEQEFCDNNDIYLVWGVGGDEKAQSSSDLVLRSRLPPGVDPNDPTHWIRWGPQGAD